jgi:serine phosphatase RsbU (regulator of sigma subunit)
MLAKTGFFEVAERDKMTDKELRKLHREDLLQILISQQRQIDELNAAMEESEAALNDKKIALEESGSIAEAALRLSGVFTAAQDAADRYTEEMRERADALVAEAQLNAEEILPQARAEAQKLLSEARREAAPAPQSAPQPPEPPAPPQDEGKRRGGLFRRKS